MKLKWKSLIFTAGILMLLSCQAFAFDSIRVNLNGRELRFDVPPQIIDGRTMVPVRAVFEAMGAEVEWNQETGTVRAVKEGHFVEMAVGQNSTRVDGVSVAIDAAPVIVNDRVLVSARFTAEGFGYRVEWDGLSRLVTISDTGLLTARFFDVGQADSQLITLPDGRVILIDAGGDIVPDLKRLEISRIDYLVATHPHSDHIAYLDEVIDAYEIGAVYMPRVSHTTKDFENLLNAVKKKGLTVQTARAGVDILTEDGLMAYFIAPVSERYDNLNDYSAVVKIQYGNCAMLFMGDAQEQSEAQIFQDASADVLKVGHHGSKTSTSQLFFNRVNPSYAVISCGTANSYGHPSDTVLRRLAGISVYRTDRDGTVTIIADEAGVQGVYTQKEGGNIFAHQAASVFYRTKTGQKYHMEGCRSLGKSKIEVSPEEIAALGLTPCGICIGA